MDKIRMLSKVGIGLAIVDFLFRGFGPLYTTGASQALTAGHFIGVGIIPLVAILSSFGLIKAKKWGFYLSIVVTLISIIGASAVFRGGEFTILSVLYLVIFGILSFMGLQQSKNLN